MSAGRLIEHCEERHLKICGLDQIEINRIDYINTACRSLKQNDTVLEVPNFKEPPLSAYKNFLKVSMVLRF